MICNIKKKKKKLPVTPHLALCVTSHDSPVKEISFSGWLLTVTSPPQVSLHRVGVLMSAHCFM